MFKNVFISISAAALLFTGLASNVSVSAQEPFVADENYDVAVSNDCNLAIKYPKNTVELQWMMGPIDSEMYKTEYYPEYAGGSLGVANYYDQDNAHNQLEYEIRIQYCYDKASTNYETLEDYALGLSYDSNPTIDNISVVQPSDLTFFTPDSRNAITKAVSYTAPNEPNRIYFETNDKYYTFATTEFFINNLNYVSDYLMYQFDSLSPSDPNIRVCLKDIAYYNNDFSYHICSLVQNSIIGGYPDGTYKPTRNVTRGEMAVFIKRAFGVETNTSCEAFSDMSSTTPFYEEAMSLKCAGIIGGSPDGKGGKQYLWNNEVSRGEMSVFIKNAANNSTEKIPTDTSCENFNDMNASTPFYTEATSLKCKSIIGGYPNSNGGRDYRPLNKVNRGELSVFIDNSRKL